VEIYSSDANIENRNWEELLAMPDGDAESFADLKRLHDDLLNTVGSNQPALKKIERLKQKKVDRPYMLCEFGFGHTTFEFLKWCYRNNGYLVTVDLPMATEEAKAKENYEEMYYWGVERYKHKYPHCIKLMENMVAQKRWLWVNDDIFDVSKRIVNDDDYRNKLFLGGEIDYFYEDAIHDDAFLANLFQTVKPFMSPGSIFTGDDNCPTHQL
jgi:hypothetical protein